MSNVWFRMYGDFINNPKVQIVTEALRYRYVALLCLHCNGDYENRPDDEIALSLRVTVDEWISTRDEFVKRELLTKDYKIYGWQKKQYISDIKDPTAADRQKRYRENKRNNRNVTVTSRLPEADTDTESKKESKTTGSRLDVDFLPYDWRAFCVETRPDLNPDEVFEEFKDYWHGVPGARGKKLDWLGTWRNRVRDKKQQNKGIINGKSSFTETGSRLVEKYRKDAEREEKAAIGGDTDAGLRLAEILRQDGS